VETGEGVWWWARSVSKPSFQVSEQQYQVANHKFKYPTTVTWNDITMQIGDTGAKTADLYDGLIKSGYVSPDGNQVAEGISKEGMRENIFGGFFNIYQLNGAGGIVEQWSLKNPKVASINFGSLEYSSDELVVIELVITYDWAELEEVSQGDGLDEYLPFK
jgi:hypothetical protein